MEAIHSHEDFIKCPYCNHEHFDQCDYGFEKHDEEKGFTCDYCDKDFSAMLHISCSFSTYKKEERC